MSRTLSLMARATVAAAAGALAASWYIRKVWLYRDPVRVAERDGRVIISPVDGKIVYVKPIKSGQIVTGKSARPYPVNLITKDDTAVDDGWIIGIHVTALDAHFQYAPIPGAVTSVARISGSADIPMLDLWEGLDATLLRRGTDLFDRTAHFENERAVYAIEGDDLRLTVVQVTEGSTGPVTDFVAPGDTVDRSQKMAFMEREVLVDLIVPKSAISFHKDVGDQVYGAQTVIATY